MQANNQLHGSPLVNKMKITAMTDFYGKSCPHTVSTVHVINSVRTGSTDHAMKKVKSKTTAGGLRWMKNIYSPASGNIK